MICIDQHRSKVIKLVCFNETCKQFPFVCEFCLNQHIGHTTISISKFSSILERYQQQMQKKNDKQNPKKIEVKSERQEFQIVDFSCSMRAHMDSVVQKLSNMRRRIIMLSKFMKDLYDMLAFIDDVGEEQDMVNLVLELLETQKDVNIINHYFRDTFLLLQPIRTTSKNPKKPKVSFLTTNICRVRSQLVMERQHEFAIQMKDCIEKFEVIYFGYQKKCSVIVEQHKNITRKTFDQYIAGPEKLQEDDPYNEILEDGEEVMRFIQSKDPNLMVRELTGIQRCDTMIPFEGSNKQMMQFHNIWIFYYNVACQGNFHEPTLRESIAQHGKRQDPPIRCAFCRLVKQREYIRNYFRFDPAKRVGQLCYFQDKYGRQVCAHELCLLWSNRVKVNSQTQEVNFQSIVMAVQVAKGQKCRFCCIAGASLKCIQPECQAHFHYHCFKGIRLMGLQVDFDTPYRFYCEDHIVRTSRFNSDWFTSRHRISKESKNDGKIIMQGEQEDENQNKKKKQKQSKVNKQKSKGRKNIQDDSDSDSDSQQSNLPSESNGQWNDQSNMDDHYSEYQKTKKKQKIN